MCWNKEVSLTTFIFAIIGVIYLWKRDRPNDRWVAVFAGTIALIQLAEFFMWSDPSCGRLNKYASIFALIILGLEPMMNMVGGLYFSNTSTSNKKILKYMLLAYIIFLSVTYFTQIHNKKITWCGNSLCDQPMSSSTGCNLCWHFLNDINKIIGIIWIIFLMIPFLTMHPMSQGLALVGLGIVTLGLAQIANSTALGSLWCWFAIGIILYKVVAR